MEGGAEMIGDAFPSQIPLEKLLGKIIPQHGSIIHSSRERENREGETHKGTERYSKTQRHSNREKVKVNYSQRH